MSAFGQVSAQKRTIPPKRTLCINNGQCISLIFAGAIGNVFDSIFYGAIFSESTYTNIASFVSIGEGYTDRLYGKVVDMFYFPLFEFDWPSWTPFIGGKHFIFFSPIFNLADAAISCGTIAILAFYPHTFGESFSLFKKTSAYKKLYRTKKVQ